MDTESDTRAQTDTYTRHSRLARPQTAIIGLDVFRLVLAYLSNAEIAAIARSSRVVCEEASRELLRRPLCISDNTGLRSFCRSMLSGHPNRVAYVQQLTLQYIDYGSTEPLTPDEKDSFVEVLRYCTGLRKITLLCCENIIRDEPRLLEAISSLPKLTRFFLPFYSDMAFSQVIYDTIRKMRGPLRALHVPDISGSSSTIDMLANLVRVHGGIEDVRMELPGPIFPTQVNPFTGIHILHLYSISYVPPARDLYRFFPNLHELTMNPCVVETRAQPNPTYIPANLSRTVSWRSLETLHVSFLEVIYQLDLQCLVRSLDIYHLNIHQQAPLDVFTDIVLRLRPQQLTIGVDCGSNVEPLRTPLRLTDEAGPGLTGLRNVLVKIRLGESDCTCETDCVVDPVVLLLQSSHVEFVHVALANRIMFDNPDELLDLRPSEVSPHTIELARGIELDAAVQAIAEACPTIRTIAITVILGGLSVWTIERSPGEEPRPVKVDPSYQRQVLAQTTNRRLHED
ncbi:hypothetical protein C8Q78DRAFT_819687 [Trametes maxima]|nr:hypothetical protein C8Q78DRAFT_819687 [Trametes maxima]